MLINQKKSTILLHGIFTKPFYDFIKKRHAYEIFVMEGRPSLQATQETCKNLLKKKAVPILITDNMAGFLFYKNLIKEVWLSYQIADKQGAICDIGSLILGILGKKHGVAVNLYPSQKKTRLLGGDGDLKKIRNIPVVSYEVNGFVPLMEWLPAKYITRVYK